ncbi:MAG: ATP-binding protein [Halocynthiibacter sp.]
MDRANIVSGAAFRTAIYAASVILLVVAVLAIMTFARVRGTLQQEMDALLLDEIRFIHEMLDDNDNDVDDVDPVQAIGDATLWIPSDTSLIGLFDAEGTRLAGNIDERPSFLGWGEIQDDGINQGGTKRTHRVNVQSYRGFVTVVGRDLALVQATLRSLARSLILVGLAAVLSTLLVGYLISRKTYKKLDRISQTLNKVSKGDVRARLSISKSNDQIDRVARLMNQHLEKLAALMTTTRSTAAAIAHDLKTPLSHAFVALDDAKNEQQLGNDPQEALDDVQRELDRLKWIFDTILRISRIEAPDGPDDFKPVDLGDLSHELLETFIPIAEEKHQILRYKNFGTGAPLINGDKAMLKQLLVNLLQNAIHHCPQRSQIQLSVNITEKGVILSVKDNGTGVPEAALNDIFSPFFQINEERSETGNGLGLALVKAVADRHHADISASNNLPGLSISVCFPHP